MKSKDIRIFLSSTYEDLKDSREKIVKFLSVLKSDLINMELFGSDEHQPKEYCLEKVRESNFFIGVYAERYGSVDTETKLSLTELEYDTALEMLNKGKLKGLLIYMIGDEAEWPIKFIERNSAKSKKLLLLKNKLKSNHTVSFFSDPEELPFNILRDTISKLESLSNTYFKTTNTKTIKLDSKLEKPVGMEFFKPEMANLFYGRENDIRDLKTQIINYSFSLLIGVSGIGKTSLLNAGILYSFSSLGWITAIVRPLNNPRKNLKNHLWNQLFQGQVPDQFNFEDVVKLAAQENPDKNILIVIDQFEDILSDKGAIEEVTFSLLQIYSYKNPLVHILVSYRGDVEADLGTIWQKISGASDGLPRYYLHPLNSENAKVIINKSLKDLFIIYDESIIERIVSDIITESIAAGYNGAFPPFIQMVVSTIYNVSRVKKGFSETDYIELGSCRGILSDYLLRQLDYLGSDREDGIKILVSLVNNYGTKSQKTIDEVSFETKIPTSNLNSLLLNLINLRLVRYFDGVYEITHDFLANIVMKGLMSEEEKNIRQFVYLLESKAAAYKTTTADLTLLEHLHLYKYRSRVSCSNEEITLFINSALSNEAPIIYWLNEEHLNAIDENLKSKFCFFINGLTIDKSELVGNTKESIKEKKLAALSLANSEEQLLIFEEQALLQGDSLNIHEIRKLIQGKTKWKLYQGLILLGSKGQKADISTLKEILYNDNYYGKSKAFAFKSLVKLSIKYKSFNILKTALVNYKGEIWSSFAKGYTVNKTDIDIKIFTDLLEENHDINVHLLSFIILSKIISTEELPQFIEIFNSKISKRNEIYTPSFYITQFWELCIKGLKFENFKFYVKMILECKIPLSISFGSFLHEKIAKLANDQDYVWLRNYIEEEIEVIKEDDKSPLLFNLYHTDKISEPENRYFIAWVTCGAFCNLAIDEDRVLVLALLDHPLWTVRNSAVKALYRIGIKEDIDMLLNMALNNTRNKEIVRGICILDKKFYENKIQKTIDNTIPKFYNSERENKKSSNTLRINPSYLFDDDLPF